MPADDGGAFHVRVLLGGNRRLREHTCRVIVARVQGDLDELRQAVVQEIREPGDPGLELDAERRERPPDRLRVASRVSRQRRRVVPAGHHALSHGAIAGERRARRLLLLCGELFSTSTTSGMAILPG
jgi:hypothetical protein